MRRLGAIGAMLLLSGCFTVTMPQPKPGEYSNYREMAYSQMRVLSFPGLPAKTQAEFRTCAVDTVYPYYTAHEIALLDAYARGEHSLTDSEINDLNREINRRMGGEDAAYAAMVATCPDTIKELQKYGNKPDAPLVVSKG